MLNLIILVFFLLVVIAVLNWKLPRKAATQWAIIPYMVLPIVGALQLEMFSIFTLDASDRLLALGEWLTVVILAFPTLSLGFFVTEYIQYRKDKENVEVIKKTLSHAVFYLACLTVLAISILYFFLRYIYNGL